MLEAFLNPPRRCVPVMQFTLTTIRMVNLMGYVVEMIEYVPNEEPLSHIKHGVKMSHT